jgi:ComF family protein
LLKIDGIIAIALHFVREKERLFNQTTFMAKNLTKLLGIKDFSHCVVKVKNPSPQSLSTFKERITKPANAFKVTKKAELKGKTILLLDDVLSSGATANELSKTLKKAGVKEIIVFAIASGDSEKKSNRVTKI